MFCLQKPHFNPGHVLQSCLPWPWVEASLRWAMYGKFHHEIIKCIQLAAGREVAGMNSWVFSILRALNLPPGWVVAWTYGCCLLLGGVGCGRVLGASTSTSAVTCWDVTADGAVRAGPLLLSSVPPPHWASSVQAQVVACPLVPPQREKWPRIGKTPRWGGNLCTHRQAGEKWDLGNVLLLRKGLNALRGWDAHVPLAQFRVPLFPPGHGLRGAAPGAGGGWEQRKRGLTRSCCWVISFETIGSFDPVMWARTCRCSHWAPSAGLKKTPTLQPTMRAAEPAAAD